jgi:hypothetical protein
LAPRAVAPEKTIDLRAMRQLANLSANTALTKHESTQLGDVTRTKLVVTVTAAFVGMLILGMSISAGLKVGIVALAIASFAVAGLWGSTYVTLTKQMLGMRTARMERHLKTGDEAPADAPRQPREAAAPDKENPSV